MLKKSACPRTIICNNCEKNKMIGEILNDGDNIDDQEYFGFTGSCFNIVPTVIDDYTKNKFIYIELKQLRPMRTDEIY